MELLNAGSDGSASTGSAHAVANGNQHITVTTRADVPLPAMHIPIFSGKPTEWMEFDALFSAHIHRKERLTDSQRLQYLKSKLDGEAAQLIRNYAVTDANYEPARNALKARYQNNRVIANAHLRVLFNQSTVKTETIVSLRKLIDTTNDCVRALNAVGVVTDTWDPVLVFLTTQRLDNTTILEWERTLTAADMPTMQNLTAFIEARCRALETVASKHTAPTKETRTANAVALQAATVPTTSSSVCILCSETHNIRSCRRFVSMTVEERTAVVREKRLCYNCLQRNHSSRFCKSSRCQQCKQRHNTLLHPIPTATSTTTAQNSTDNSTPSTHHRAASGTLDGANITSANSSIDPQNVSSVLLATAYVTLQACDGTLHSVRALLDTGSQASFISEDCVHRLKLPRKHAVLKVNGVGSSDAGMTRGLVSLKLGSQYKPTLQMAVDALVLNRITGFLPTAELKDHKFSHLTDVKLADPCFFKPGKIDVLLGADVHCQIILPEILRGAPGTPTAQRTLLGWVLSGTVRSRQTPTADVAALHTLTELEAALKRFWELETIAEHDNRTEEEKYCETHFKSTHLRDPDGHFAVQLPLKANWTALGSSKLSAIARLRQLEGRFRRDPQLKCNYVDFVNEYIALGHMERITADANDLPGCYYIPHHAVFKNDSTTTKLRVVFDASNKTSSGLSLNDVLMVGPTVQPNLYDIILRFRKYSIALSADVAKMYRQVRMQPIHKDLQRIVWRNHEDENIEIYRLATVTYGTASAPFLAIRSLIECTEGYRTQYPDACDAILRDMYVDDLITGVDNETDAIIRQQQISDILISGGFELRKWASNSSSVLQKIPTTHRECKESLLFAEDESIKALGIRWFPSTDHFGYQVNLSPTDINPTKRIVLADTARLFDPLGLLSPVVITAKIVDDSGMVQVRLITSKTKVAPVQQITVPRLELCGAALLAQLMAVVKKSLGFDDVEVYMWTDSLTVLAWLRKLPGNWKTFVANRVSLIQSSTEPSCWKYVPTLENPADVASRGVHASELITHHLWWHGPQWLKNEVEFWPKLPQKANMGTNRDIRQSTAVSMTGTITASSWQLVDKYSSLQRLKRVTAYVRRFLGNVRRPVAERDHGPLVPAELDGALMFWIKAAATELSRICSKNEIISKSQLRSLHPFLDDQGLLRVGGRIDASSLPYETKHQIILPGKSRISQLIIADFHKSLLHGGVQLMMANLRQRYWLPKARSTLRQFVHRCVTCFRHKGQFAQQQMGNLPPQRLTPSRPFINSGVDYAGPIMIRTSELRKCKITKGYIAVFVCLSTKALHLELVSELTTEAFIAAFRRFVARRGICKVMMSDNGTNFVGAQRELKELSEMLQSQYLSMKLANQGTEWKLIPPGAPHFGGIWEAGVKSVKHHIKRVIGATQLTFEKMATLLTQIEACLNSRPLTPLSDDPEDVNALTPGHFLIGEPLTSAPDPNVMDIKINKLSQWQHLQRMQQDFWSRWKMEYIGELQQRPKWMQASPNILIGDLVILKDERLPPTFWPLGRVMDVHPGTDGKVRVVSVKYNGSVSTRSIHKLCIVPKSQN